jgi:hypothetical protein
MVHNILLIIVLSYHWLILGLYAKLISVSFQHIIHCSVQFEAEYLESCSYLVTAFVFRVLIVLSSHHVDELCFIYADVLPICISWHILPFGT